MFYFPNKILCSALQESSNIRWSPEKCSCICDDWYWSFFLTGPSAGEGRDQGPFILRCWYSIVWKNRAENLKFFHFSSLAQGISQAPNCSHSCSQCGPAVTVEKGVGTRNPVNKDPAELPSTHAALWEHVLALGTPLLLCLCFSQFAYVSYCQPMGLLSLSVSGLPIP